MNEFLVEVNISLPNGERLEDWKWVARLVEFVEDDKLTTEVEVVAEKIRRAILKWREENP